MFRIFALRQYNLIVRQCKLDSASTILSSANAILGLKYDKMIFLVEISFLKIGNIIQI